MNSLLKPLTWLVLVALLAAGCEEIRPANQLTIEPVQPTIDGPVRPVSLRFRDVVWTPEGEDVLVVAFGSDGGPMVAPIEHLTPGQLRYFYISRDIDGAPGHEYIITLVAASSLFQVDPYTAPPALVFQGTLPTPTKLFLDQMQFTLNRLPMAAPGNEGPIGSVFLSGRIVADFTSQSDFMEKKAPFAKAASAALNTISAYSRGEAQAREDLEMRP
jgi:hypothetical protein